MDCGLISDLHLEQVKFYAHQKRAYYKQNRELVDGLMFVPPPSKKLRVLFIAGDLCEFRFRDLWHAFLGSVVDYAEQIVVVDGNHESYKSNYQKLPVYVAELERQFPNVKFLDNESMVIDGLHVFGTCLWTDFGFNDLVIKELSDRYSSILVDRNLIKIKWLNRCVKGRDIQSLSVRAKGEIAKWLERTVEQPRRLLLTHYPPLPDKTPAWSKSFPNLEPSFLRALDLIDCTDCSDLLASHSDVVVAHGHLHGVESYHARTGNRVYCNPRGVSDPIELGNAGYKILEFSL